MKLKITILYLILMFFIHNYSSATNYYLKTGASNVTILSNWSLTLDGSGASPANFTTNDQVFIIVNNASITLSSSWSVSGTGSKVVVGDGSGSFTFIMNSTLSTAPIDITDNSTLSIAVSTNPTFGTIGSASTVNYSRAGNQSITATTYGNLTTSGSGSKSLGGSTIVNGSLTLNTTLSVGNNTFSFTNDILGTKTFFSTASNSKLIILGTSPVTMPSNFTTVGSIQLNNAGGLSLASSLVMSLPLTLTTGDFNVGSNTITFNTNSSIQGTKTNFKTTSSSSMVVFTNAPVTLPTSVSNLNNLNLSNGASLTISSALNISGILTLTSGVVSSGTNLNMNTGSSIVRLAGSILTEPNATTTYDLTYSTTGSGTTITGPELPAVTTKLNNLTISSNNATRQITLNKNVTVNGNISITMGILSFSTFTVILKGNFINSLTNTSFVCGTSTINFNGVTSLTTTDENEFNNVTVSGTLNGPSAFALKVKGNFVNTGTFTHNNGTVKFSGTTTISGASTTTFYNIDILSGASLTGKSSGNFNVANNFNNDGTAYNANNGTVTFTGSACTITGATSTTFKNVAITGTLTAPVNLNLTGNFTNSGTFVQGANNVNFSAAGNKDIGGTTVTTFNNINVSAGTLRVENVNANLTGSLTLSGTGTFDSDGSSNNRTFTLVSNASGTARIATIPSTASITGNVTLQRYTTGLMVQWTLMGTPLKTRTLANWTSNFPTSGFPGATGTAGGFVSIYSDNEALATSLNDPNRYVAPTSSSNPITVGDGYWVYLGDSQGASRNLTISMSGNPQFNRQGGAEGDFDFGVTRTGGSDPGWNLIANPFPSEIDWSSTTGWTKTNIDNTIYYYDAAFSGDQYISYLDLGGGSGIAEDPSVNGTIASSQAVYVQATGASPILKCDERVKSSTHSNPNFHKNTAVSTTPLVRLKLTNGTLNSSTVIYMNDNATAGFDQGYDSKDFTDTVAYNNIDLSTKAGSTYLSINGIPPVNSNISIPVRTLVGTLGSFDIFASTIDNVDQSICITLFDSLNNTYTNLRTDTLNVVLSDTLTQPRFFLNFTADNSVGFTKNISQPTCSNASNYAAINPSGTGPFNIIWKDVNDNIIRNTLNTNSADTMYNLSSGGYKVEVYNGSACGFVSDVFSIDNVSANNAAFATQDPNCNGAHNAQITAVPSGNSPYHYVWFDNNSNVIRETIGSNTSDALTNIGTGNYSVTISFNNGCSVSQSFTIIDPPLPSASFINVDSVDINNADSILFLNNSTAADNYEWVITGDVNSYTDNDLIYSFTAEGTYTLTLTAMDNNCNSTSVTSNNIVVYAPVVTSIVNNIIATEGNDIKLFNNLGAAQLQFNYASENVVFITVYDALGQRLNEQLKVRPNNQIINLDLTNVSSQLLFINVSGQEKNQTFKIFNK